MKTKTLILTALFAALTAAGAFIRIPAPPAPITLQFMFAAFSGILLGPYYGALSQLVYVCAGLLGLPVFTQGGGLSYVLQPSFGFLIGMIAAAFLIGKIADRIKPGFWGAAAACLIGLAVLYLIGLPYMYLVLRYYMGSNVTLSQAVWSGMVLYLPGDIIKIIIVSLASARILPAIRAYGIKAR